MKIPKDIELKLKQLFPDLNERQEAETLVKSIYETSLMVGPNQLSRSILFLSEGEIQFIRDVIKSKFAGDPRDVIMMAERKAGNPGHYFIPPFDIIK